MKKTLHQKLISAIVMPTEQWEKLDNAEAVCGEFAVGFSLFCAENAFNYVDGNWQMKGLIPTFKTTEELLTIFKEQINK